MADNDILKEQRKARQDFLDLKKMQHGEMQPEPKPSEIAIEPKTFKEKRQNFWFHYKWHTVATIFTAIVLTILCVQCAGREKYDYDVVFFTYEACLDAQMDGVKEYLEQYSTDIDGNSEVNVNVINCSFSEISGSQYKNSILTKVQTQIIGNKEALIYILDDKAYEYLNNIVENGIFVGEKVTLNQEFYELTETEAFGSLPENLGIYLRRVEGTTYENDKDVKPIFEECEKVIDKIKNEP